MPASSSATRMLPARISTSLSACSRRKFGRDRHQDPKHRVPGLRLALNHTAMISNDLRDQGEPEAGPGGFGSNERVKQVRHQVFGDPGPVVLDAKFERERNARFGAWYR